MAKSSETALIENCTSDVSRWFLENALLLNPTKTEAPPASVPHTGQHMP